MQKVQAMYRNRHDGLLPFDLFGCVVHAPVDEYAANDFGLHNVHGNVWEHCLDGESGTFYGTSPELDPVCPPNDSSLRVIRGGGFGSAARYARSANRDGNAPFSAKDHTGLRPARKVDY